MSKETQVLWQLKKRETGVVYKNIDLSALKTWILEARVDPTDLLTNAQLQTWVPAAQIEEIASYFSPESTGSDLISSQDMELGWRRGGLEEMEFDMTPMIDLTFLLLIFFMVTATFAIHEVKSIQVPPAQITEAHKQEKLAIAVDAQQHIYLLYRGKKEINLDKLKQEVAGMVSQTLQRDIVLAADRSLNYGFVVKILDEINGAGIANVKLKLEKQRENR